MNDLRSDSSDHHYGHESCFVKNSQDYCISTYLKRPVIGMKIYTVTD